MATAWFVLLGFMLLAGYFVMRNAKSNAPGG